MVCGKHLLRVRQNDKSRLERIGNMKTSSSAFLAASYWRVLTDDSAKYPTDVVDLVRLIIRILINVSAHFESVAGTEWPLLEKSLQWLCSLGLGLLEVNLRLLRQQSPYTYQWFNNLDRMDWKYLYEPKTEPLLFKSGPKIEYIETFLKMCYECDFGFYWVPVKYP